MATGSNKFREPQPRSKLHMLVAVGTMEVKTPLDTTVEAVRVIVKFALMVVGINTVVEASVEVNVDTDGVV